MNTLYNKNTVLSKYKGEKDEKGDVLEKSVDETKNRPFICATKSLYGEAPLSIKDLNDKIEPNVTMFILPYESQGVIKYRIYCYLYSELKAFLMSSPVLFRFNEKSPDKSFPILKIQDVYIEFNYFLLLRYSAFVLVNPITIPIGSSSGVFENVYEVKPVSKTKFLQTGNINFFDLNKRNVDFSELDFAPGNSPPYKIELLYENDRIREREVSNSLPVIENIFYLKGLLAMCLNNSKTDAFDFQASGDGSYSKIFFSNEIVYYSKIDGEMIMSNVRKDFRSFKRDYREKIEIGNTKATVKKIKNVEIVMVERNGEQVLKEYIIEWNLKNIGREYEEIIGLDENKEEKIELLRELAIFLKQAKFIWTRVKNMRQNSNDENTSKAEILLNTIQEKIDMVANYNPEDVSLNKIMENITIIKKIIRKGEKNLENMPPISPQADSQADTEIFENNIPSEPEENWETGSENEEVVENNIPSEPEEDEARWETGSENEEEVVEEEKKDENEDENEENEEEIIRKRNAWTENKNAWTEAKTVWKTLLNEIRGNRDLISNVDARIFDVENAIEFVQKKIRKATSNIDNPSRNISVNLIQSSIIAAQINKENATMELDEFREYIDSLGGLDEYTIREREYADEED